MAEDNIWKEIGDNIVSTAPALGALLAPVTGGVSAMIGTGVGILGKIFGLGDKPDPDALRNAIATDPQAALKLSLADKEWQLEMYRAETDRMRVQLEDLKSARERESSVKDNTNKILAYSIVGAFIALVGGTLLGYAKVDSALAGTLVGYLSAKCEQILAYYFGSSRGSAEKTVLLAQADAIKNLNK
jgi:hypothetical protein